MLIKDKVENAVRLQACGYQLLKWLEKALRDGFITPEAAGIYATSEDAAYAWLDKHYLNCLRARVRNDLSSAPLVTSSPLIWTAHLIWIPNQENNCTHRMLTAFAPSVVGWFRNHTFDQRR